MQDINFTATNQSEEEFIASINAWFAQNRNISIQKMLASSKTSLGLLVNKDKFNDITFLYEQDDKYNNYYGIAVKEKFSLRKIGLQEMKEQWIYDNPELKYVSSSYVHNLRGQVGSFLIGGLGGSNMNRLCVLYKHTSATAPTPKASAPAPAVQQTAAARKFCTSCGAKLEADAKFCTGCGRKI